jgi:regulatory protein
MPPREPSLRERALRFLAAREHSRTELRRKLAPHADSAEELDRLLEELTGGKQQSDARFAEARSHVLSRKYGASRIAHDLRSKGVSDEEAQSAVAVARATDLERAREVYHRKFRSPPSSREDRARHMRFLQSRGFSFDVIKALMQGDPEAE